MKRYIHARLSAEDRMALDDLSAATGLSESEIVRRGIRLVRQELGQAPSALALAGRSVGKFADGPADLSTNPRHLEDFGR